MPDSDMPTAHSALRNAGRLLENAEMETDLAKMKRLEKLADSWVNIAGMLLAAERSI